MVALLVEADDVVDGAAGGAASFQVPHRSLGRRLPLDAGAAGSDGVVARRHTAWVAGRGAT